MLINSYNKFFKAGQNYPYEKQFANSIKSAASTFTQVLKIPEKSEG